ncbi:hypothetical protein BIT28_19725 [Photobacterium proteolyticum]|uniref:EamA domain-containing protein n=1 Tax=Photobacterium proteolyticum TaxID=1903952 RepID=A0A1Q9GIB3_9GAMM|nr:DMT family transporter [Photobacterium proteolyticum]OLQ74110.1 hypothetical protein BIT28_19725 [Photobacterium proteolyticum]
MTQDEKPFSRVMAVTTLAMLAFAGNSLLNRVALLETDIDAATFTTIRLVSGSAVLWLISIHRSSAQPAEGNWLSALALFVYAAGFSFAYISLSAATGALLLFAAVQTTMLGYGLWQGERLTAVQWLGFGFAISGLLGLLLPGLSAPPLVGSVLMLAAGVAWGIYSIRGKTAGDPVLATTGNFLRAVPFTLVLSVIMLGRLSPDWSGVGYAVLSGAIASGLGYVMWYSVLPALQATTAATVQLSVPVIAAIGGVLFLGESISLRLFLASIAILGGIALVLSKKG